MAQTNATRSKLLERKLEKRDVDDSKLLQTVAYIVSVKYMQTVACVQAYRLLQFSTAKRIQHHDSIVPLRMSNLPLVRAWD